MTTNLTEKEIEEFREIFNMVDTTHSGKITKHELLRLMDRLNLRPTEEEQLSMLNNVFDSAFSHPSGEGGSKEGRESLSKSGEDGNRGSISNSTIDFNQFVAIMAKRVQVEYTPEQLRNAFRQFETGDLPFGVVSTSVLKLALMTYGSERLSSEDADKLIAVVDPKGTGEINYIDFVSIIFDKE
ncbi:unnamed protein product [Phytomonas sp. Hart1]|nr:unnamed protein product [Phytomonas sp. Hart1]|eukprot:CCW66780.1 unnamed protein product [Phytomonas sp. isolate Hart1]